VHLFCTELMPDFQPSSEVIWLILNSGISSSNHDPDLIPFVHRTLCLPLWPGRSLTMQ
jgi:hypothetical protein